MNCAFSHFTSIQPQYTSPRHDCFKAFDNIIDKCYNDNAITVDRAVLSLIHVNTVYAVRQFPEDNIKYIFFLFLFLMELTCGKHFIQQTYCTLSSNSSMVIQAYTKPGTVQEGSTQKTVVKNCSDSPNH